jgi:hypothetical protein
MRPSKATRICDIFKSIQTLLRGIFDRRKDVDTRRRCYWWWVVVAMGVVVVGGSSGNEDVVVVGGGW